MSSGLGLLRNKKQLEEISIFFTVSWLYIEKVNRLNNNQIIDDDTALVLIAPTSCVFVWNIRYQTYSMCWLRQSSCVCFGRLEIVLFQWCVVVVVVVKQSHLSSVLYNFCIDTVMETCLLQIQPMKSEAATLHWCVCECFLWSTAPDCFCPSRFFVPYRDKVCQTRLWMFSGVYKRASLLLFGQLCALCPVLSGCTSWANSSRVCIQECVCVCLLTLCEGLYSSIPHFPTTQFHAALNQYIMMMWALLHHTCQVQSRSFTKRSRLSLCKIVSWCILLHMH